MDDDNRYYYPRELVHAWQAWDTLERGDAVVRLRDEGYSLRQLAKIAGCTEGTIRNYEILGRVPLEAKRILCDGQTSMRRLVQWAREARKAGN